LSWPLALLLAAIVGSTDAAAVFSPLKSSGVKLNERVAATLEIESGMNDPMAVYLTLTFIGVALAATAGPTAGAGLDAAQVLRSLLQQFGWDAALGLGAGFGLAELLKRLRTGPTAAVASARCSSFRAGWRFLPVPARLAARAFWRCTPWVEQGILLYRVGKA